MVHSKTDLQLERHPIDAEKEHNMQVKGFHLIGTVQSHNANLEVKPSDTLEDLKFHLSIEFGIWDRKGMDNIVIVLDSMTPGVDQGRNIAARIQNARHH